MFVFKHPKYYSELKKNKPQAQATGGKEEKEKELEKDTGEKKNKKNLKKTIDIQNYKIIWELYLLFYNKYRLEW